MNIHGYLIEVRTLALALGGGFVAYAPDLRGCVADGESRTMALLNLEEAMSCWIEEATAIGRPVPNRLLADASS